MDFSPGFRMRWMDLLILLSGAVVTILVFEFSWYLSFIIGFVCIHFFLFCNVCRITRIAELIWAGLFIVSTALSSLLDLMSWNVVVGIMLAGTLLVLTVEIRRPSYHGIFWRQLNPDLPDWWSNHVSERTKTAGV